MLCLDISCLISHLLVYFGFCFCGLCMCVSCFFIVCFLKRQKEKAWNWVNSEVRRIWKESGEGKSVIRIYCMKSFFNKKIYFCLVSVEEW